MHTTQEHPLKATKQAFKGCFVFLLIYTISFWPLAIGEVVKQPIAIVNNLYKTRKRKDTNFNATKKITPVGRKKASSWKKICFQLDKFFFPTGNPVLGG
ncbi:MAG: hypothetical protein UIC63_03640, partial [Bacteroidaceae bacterium]|nr:hypothetical protein [Bacteroidaceae bacterium]